MLLRVFRFFGVMILAGHLSGCGQAKLFSSTQKAQEQAYCSTKSSYSNAKSISGVAAYQRREFIDSCMTGGTCYLGEPGPMRPIRHAEVQVRSGGNIVQCGETNEEGQFEVQVPPNSQYTVQIFSRSSNDSANVSVLENPKSKEPHAIATSFSVEDQNVDLGTILAPATMTLEGGAFNILDQILHANEYLRLRVSADAGCKLPSCHPFSVAPKVTVYWAPGVNPGTYFGSSALVSFYVSSQDSMYILGGADGAVDDVDTDHFDNTVILHEYAHFLEDQFSKSDSPGGRHNGDAIIDPRLAWSEGFANYFGVLVNSHFYPQDTFYRDSYGNVSSFAKGVLFNYNVETNSPPRDVSSESPGEGNFREFAIARFLLMASNISTSPFLQEFWTTFSGAFKSPSVAFRSFGLFFELYEKQGFTNLTTLYSRNGTLLRNNRLDFATPDHGDACSFTTEINGPMQRDPYDTPEYWNVNQFRSADFYHYSHPGGNLSVDLHRLNGNQDLDIYLYPSNYVFGENYLAVDNTANTGDEQISKNLPSGEYMISVMSTSGEIASDYDLKYSNSITANDRICP